MSEDPTPDVDVTSVTPEDPAPDLPPATARHFLGWTTYCAVQPPPIEEPA